MLHKNLFEHHIISKDSMHSKFAGDLFICNRISRSRAVSGHNCINYLLRKKMQRMREHISIDVGHTTKEVYQNLKSSTSKRFQITSSNEIIVVSNKIKTHGSMKNKDKNYNSVRSSSSLFRQLRNNGMDKRMAWRRHRNYSKLLLTVGAME
mmetsp:Transcript_33316/g.36863  ORF Transcript_33316/g.36863 Transcript_33316/m.36863 type:complete len:151 (+) Transcript_33316:66-518(+)